MRHKIVADGLPTVPVPPPAPPAVRYEPVYQRLVVPIRPTVEAELFVPSPMTVDDWDQFMIVLAAMKPGLVREPTPDSSASCENRQG